MATRAPQGIYTVDGGWYLVATAVQRANGSVADIHYWAEHDCESQVLR